MRLKEIFSQYDADGSGTITLKELQQFFTRTGNEMKELAADFLASVDKDGDGTITFVELLKELYPYTSTNRLQQLYKQVVHITLFPWRGRLNTSPVQLGLVRFAGLPGHSGQGHQAQAAVRRADGGNQVHPPPCTMLPPRLPASAR